MARVITYIDGFNLYFGIKDSSGNRYLWLNVEALSNSLIRPEDELIDTEYFTSRVTHDQSKEKRQNTYLEALIHGTATKIYFGRYQVIKNVIVCNKCGATRDSKKEKMTDVQIATELLTDAFTDRFDRAILITGDTDLIPTVQAVKAHHPDKEIGVFFPPNRILLIWRTG